jgi:hypothetical protein
LQQIPLEILSLLEQMPGILAPLEQNALSLEQFSLDKMPFNQTSLYIIITNAQVSYQNKYC